jgi:hypothetical protein
VIVCKERPHPARKLRTTDASDSASATQTTPAASSPTLNQRYRRRARCEHCIRVAQDTGPTSLPLQNLAQNKTWWAIVALVVELSACCRCSPWPAAMSPWELNTYGLLSLAAHLARTQPHPTATPVRTRALGRAVP